MVRFIDIVDGIPLYEDPLMEDDKIIKGRKQNDVSEYTYGMNPGCTFMVANPKTANIIYSQFKKKLRKEKLNKINDI